MRGSTPEVSSGARACKQPQDTELMAWYEYTSPGSGGRLHGLRWMCFAHPRGEAQSLGGGRYRGGSGSWCFQPMCRSILSITVGSVMKEIICILPPHLEQSRGSSFQTFLINFAQRMRLHLRHSLSSPVVELSPSAGGTSLSPGTLRCLSERPSK